SLVASQIAWWISDQITYMPQGRAGNITSYGVTADTRLSTAPDIPTVDEAGLHAFHVALWHGLWMPKGTPKAIIAKLNTSVVAALADPAAQAKLAELGQEI